jgi:hypothetical protein
MKESREWDDAISQAKKTLGFSKNEFVEDWGRIVAMAKEVLAEGRGDRPPGTANDKRILAHYLSGTTIPERFLSKRGAQGD